jgi:uncharacterized protein (TIGR02145 family)
MRKLLLTTAAVAAAIGVAVAGEPSFGTLTDTRDGQTYKTVKMPDGKTWMAQNLNYLPPNGKSWCYNNDTSYCNKYGRLYDWKTATTVCPKGWKLPSREDWNRLVATAGGEEIASKKLKSKSGWKDYKGKNGNGTDDFGFSALPGGYRITDGYFYTAGNYGYWWTASEDSDGYAYFRYMDYDIDYVYEYYDDKGFGFSVRCIADRP